MFHTCFNAPLEWATAEDSGLLIANIIRQDTERDLGQKFWGKVFNLGGGQCNCVTGYDILNDGFEIIGGTVKNFFEPAFNATRNFHGLWFTTVMRSTTCSITNAKARRTFGKNSSKRTAY